MTALSGAVVMLMAWWAGTALVLKVSRMVGVHRRSALTVLTAGAGVALWLLRPIAQAEGPGAALVAALAGFAIWFWVEVSFYSGWITGLAVGSGSQDDHWRARMARALKACLWHELVSLALLVVIAALVLGEPNHWSGVIYGAFWLLHQISRLNVLAGVPRQFSGWLPDHLAHLHTMFRPGPSGGRLELTIVVLGVLAAASVAMMWMADETSRPGWAALSMLLWIGAAEHVVLLGWIDLDRLWRVAPTARGVEPRTQSSTNSGAGARRL